MTSPTVIVGASDFASGSSFSIPMIGVPQSVLLTYSSTNCELFVLSRSAYCCSIERRRLVRWRSSSVCVNPNREMRSASASSASAAFSNPLSFTPAKSW